MRLSTPLHTLISAAKKPVPSTHHAAGFPLPGRLTKDRNPRRCNVCPSSSLPYCTHRGYTTARPSHSITPPPTPILNARRYSLPCPRTCVVQRQQGRSSTAPSQVGARPTRNTENNSGRVRARAVPATTRKACSLNSSARWSGRGWLATPRRIGEAEGRTAWGTKGSFAFEISGRDSKFCKGSAGTHL